MKEYSHSKLSVFDQCRYRYKLNYIDQLVPAIPTTIEAYLGSMVHLALEYLYRRLQEKFVPSLEDVLRYYETEWVRGYQKETEVASKCYTAADYMGFGRKHLSDYYHRYQPFDQFETVGLETKEFLPLANGSRYHIRIDRLARDKEGNYIVIDYKTGAHPKQEAIDNDRQLSMYVLWVHKTYPEAKRVRLLWTYFNPVREFWSERSREKLDEIKGQVETKISEIERCSDYSANVTRLCGWCGYKDICATYQSSRLG